MWEEPGYGSNNVYMSHATDYVFHINFLAYLRSLVTQNLYIVLSTLLRQPQGQSIFLKFQFLRSSLCVSLRLIHDQPFCRRVQVEAVDHGVEVSCDNLRHRYEVCYPNVEVMDVSYGVHPRCEGISGDA